MERQQQLPGVGPKPIPEIEDAAETLYALRKERQALAGREEEAQQTLRDLLKKHGIRKNKPYIFEIDGDDGEPLKLDVLVQQKEERAYVRKHKDPKDEKEEDEEAGEKSFNPDA